jgi:hypothetical protein
VAESLEWLHYVLLRRSEKIETVIKQWHGDDPVSKLYSSIFQKDMVIDLASDAPGRKNQLQDFERRTKNQIPPGYKDASKPDGGIGDVLIWQTILQLGSTRKSDLTFVTGEEKADWFNRMGDQPVYPRYELIDEYRRTSGRVLSLLRLHELLEVMGAKPDVLSEVRSAEKLASESNRSDAPIYFLQNSSGTFYIPGKGFQLVSTALPNTGLQTVNRSSVVTPVRVPSGELRITTSEPGVSATIVSEGSNPEDDGSN